MTHLAARTYRFDLFAEHFGIGQYRLGVGAHDLHRVLEDFVLEERGPGVPPQARLHEQIEHGRLGEPLEKVAHSRVRMIAHKHGFLIIATTKANQNNI